MAKDKLILYGHVHNRPDHKVSSYYSWPKGVEMSELKEIIERFTRAFVPLRVEAILDNIQGGWYFNGNEFEFVRGDTLQ